MSQYGLIQWHEDEKAEVDILFVHGLRGGRVSTWTKNEVIWPKELLAKDIPKSRILSFGYDSGIIHSDSAEVTQGSLADDARQLCSLLDDRRKETHTKDRPIVVVGHSMGGLVLAQVIYGGNQATDGDSIKSISQKIIGMVFLGTPFYGSKIAGWADVARRIFNLVQRTDQTTLRNLTLDSKELKDLRFGFPEIVRQRNQTADKLAVVFFFEQKATGKVWIVKEEDASYPGVGEILPIRENHINICKYDDEEDNGYKSIRAKIKQVIEATRNAEQKENSGNYGITVHGKVVNLTQHGDIRIENQTNNF
ncbi:hypothetical protein BU24DRAFT_397585 [Aaosphaeria arxii CBS 175.79]|uniref:AB hydrolase-1 domain-containing protein n=1 Tax=Aaosphaeria arxii CBS 175.79 TaxID=1450172 RepID=A0A6A5XDK2_9PLEO|nr:uncharacterized protein BU24DRAFT_397585 [Aaosphaeria arxii CBS 175.79]KAF2011215.1 hypothetical protein BU24DRAFT_397585 [Aaosphaeria arxii CBS 175.79]